jgi:hypothetical protein
VKNLIVSSGVLEKLRDKHSVTVREVEQCFTNLQTNVLTDNRERHRTIPPTRWFISPTNKGRLLKVVYVRNGASIDLKSAFDPNQTELEIYRKYK